MIRIKIKLDDVSTVAKVVLIDQKSRILFLKRSDYMEKYAGQWDLPGGHLKDSESLEAGLAREVKEETSLTVTTPVLFLKLDNIHFFYAMYDSQEVILSHEHTDYKFFERQELDGDEKFQKVAMRALEVRHESIN
jgi:8-oxo-dGTP pyrophosphatase MutT (NUDIX family)